MAQPARLTLVSLFLSVIFITAVPACSTHRQPRDGVFSPEPPFSVGFRASTITVVGYAGDEDAIQDVAKSLTQLSPQICEDLNSDCDITVIVELFPDQPTFNRLGMNPEMQGFYAYSGDGRIQMVTPKQAVPGLSLDYSQRVAIAAHEFVHLLNDEINPNMPVWMDEGVAIYIGPHPAYEYVTQRLFPFDQIPPFQTIEESYNSIPAGDLFAYAIVDFIVADYGLEALNRIIREPASFESILGVSRSNFEMRWRKYMGRNYHSG